MNFEDMNVSNYETCASNLDSIAYNLGSRAPRKATGSIIQSMLEVVGEYDYGRDDNYLVYKLLVAASACFADYESDEERERCLHEALEDVVEEATKFYGVEVA